MVRSTNTFSAMGIAVASFASGTSRIDNNMVYGVVANSTPGDFSAGIFVGIFCFVAVPVGPGSHFF